MARRGCAYSSRTNRRERDEEEGAAVQPEQGADTSAKGLGCLGDSSRRLQNAKPSSATSRRPFREKRHTPTGRPAMMAHHGGRVHVRFPHAVRTPSAHPALAGVQRQGSCGGQAQRALRPGGEAPPPPDEDRREGRVFAFPAFPPAAPAKIIAQRHRGQQLRKMCKPKFMVNLEF